MPLLQLKLDGQPAWEFDYHLPALWPWLFDAGAITESRRLHSTVYDAAVRFQEAAARLQTTPDFQALAAIFREDLRPDRFARALDAPPDALLSLDLRSLEEQRPYQHEKASEHWEHFFTACARGDEATAREEWQQAALNPLAVHGGTQRDALALAARAEELGLDRQDRAQALVWLLFGQPVSRPARALNHVWAERAAELPAAHYVPKRPWWRRVAGM